MHDSDKFQESPILKNVMLKPIAGIKYQNKLKNVRAQ